LDSPSENDLRRCLVVCLSYILHGLFIQA
jgi:hypothetical protein